MIEIGKTQKLKMGREVDFGIYLTDGEKEVLLPQKYIPFGTQLGDEIEAVGMGRPAKKTVVTGIEMFRKPQKEAKCGDNVGILTRLKKDDLPTQER